MTQPDSRPDAPALEPESAHHPDLPRRFGRKFQLGIDQAAPADIDARIRDSVELTGTTPWILMSAILIASIGLNVNSTAVIIGAMLISPLMGPIIGIGYSMARLATIHPQAHDIPMDLIVTEAGTVRPQADVSTVRALT